MKFSTIGLIYTNMVRKYSIWWIDSCTAQCAQSPISISEYQNCGSVFLFGLSLSCSSKSHWSSPTYRLKTTSRNAPKLTFFRAKIWKKSLEE